jgi:hypothetical protein
MGEKMVKKIRRRGVEQHFYLGKGGRVGGTPTEEVAYNGMQATFVLR